MRPTRRVFAFSLISAGLWLVTGCSRETGQRSPAGQQPDAPQSALAVQEVTVVGKNLCLGCQLKKALGAKAQCSKYGHRHVLEVESAVGPTGEAVKGLAGRTLHYLDNDHSVRLIRGDELHGKRVEVEGRLFTRQATIEVREAHSR